MKPRPTPEQVARVVLAAARAFRVPPRLIIDRCRTLDVASARLAVYAALYRGCATSRPAIARLFNRDNSTVFYGCRKALRRAADDAEYAQALATIEEACRA